ncbi:hypothetical protein [Pseudomonas lopnurensis]|uniref:hypothetical protein n=1 Tax=Pseudomonas lopnurensis TaxID=1477517 RepID=UPI0028B18045|nr:hypothetical protein [Pseudomonas lopnurensis]
MDLNAVIQSAGEQRAADVLKNFLEKFLNPAFGALPKSEIELLVLSALEEVGAVSSESGIYELVSKLKITRSKARNLIYERELRRLSASELDARVKEILKKPIIQKSGEVFILEIESPLISDHLRSKVQQLGYITDGSFSPSVVKLSLDAVVALIELYIPPEDLPGVKAALIEAGAPDQSVRGVLKAVLKKVAGKVASDTGEAVLESTSEYLSPIIDGAFTGLKDKFSELFPQPSP